MSDAANGDATPTPDPGGDPAADAAAQRAQGRLYLRLVAYGALIGLPAAGLAALFLALVNKLQTWLWTDLPDQLGVDTPPWYLVIGLPVVGAVLVWIARRFLPGDGGHSPLKGFAGGPTPWQHGPGIALAALGTLAFGAVLGPEAPLIALGSVVGMVVVANVKVDGMAQGVLATAGSFSAVSALFGGPLVAGILLLEAGLAAGSALTLALLPGLVAAAVGYLLFVGLGSWGGLNEQSMAVPGLPAYDSSIGVDLLLAIVVGVLTALIIVVVRRIASGVDGQAKARWTPVLFVGALAVGLIAQLATVLNADAVDVLFSGEASVPAEIATTSAGTLMVLLLAKGLGYAICLGCGFRGGPVFPAIFIGIAVASLAVDLFGASPTWAVAVGAAAGMTAGTRLVFAAVLFSTLLVGPIGVDALPASVLATVAAWLTVTAIQRRHPDEDSVTSATPAPAG